MKRLFVISMLLCLVVLGGCKKSDKIAVVSVSNPMIEVKDSASFKEQLGISIDCSYFPDDARLFVIAGEVAQIDYFAKGVDGEDIECTFRATKNKETSKSLDGIYASDREFLGVISGAGDGSVDIKTEFSESLNCHIYSFYFGDTYFSYVYTGSGMSHMQLAERLDRIFAAIGSF